MKYIKLFNEHPEYQEYISGNADLPNVSYCIEEDEVHYNPITPGIIDGYEYVDLGLPSGTLWATMNVGATNVTDYGDYYMYGMGSKTYDSSDTPYVGTEAPLLSNRDTASVVWGGSWHMPNRAQLQELLDNTTYQWVTDYQGSGIDGGLFTAQNGNSVFIPAAGGWNGGSQLSVGDNGGYWGSSPGGSDSAYGLSFSNGYKDVGNYSRKYGFSVRPVWNNTPAPSGDR